MTEESPKLESLWIEESHATSAFGPHSKLFSRSKERMSKLISRFDGSPRHTTPQKLISTPFGFDHVAHMDSERSFGLENSFQDVDTDVLHEIASSRKQKSTDHVTDDQETSTSHSMQAYSSFRTTPTAPGSTSRPVSTVITGGSPKSGEYNKHSRSASTTSSFTNSVSRSNSVFTMATNPSSVASSPLQMSTTRGKGGKNFTCRPVTNGELIYRRETLAPIPQEADQFDRSTSSGSSLCASTDETIPTKYSRLSIVSRLSNTGSLSGPFSYSSTEPPKGLDNYTLLQGLTTEGKLQYIKSQERVEKDDADYETDAESVKLEKLAVATQMGPSDSVFSCQENVPEVKHEKQPVGDFFGDLGIDNSELSQVDLDKTFRSLLLNENGML